MSLLQIASLILITYIRKCTSATLDKTIQPSGEIWLEQSGSDLEPTWNHSYNTIQLGQVMSIEFDFKFYGRSNDCNCQFNRAGYTENFFRIGHTAKGGVSACDGEKSSYPAMFLASSGRGNILDIKVSSGTSCTSTNYLTDYGELNTNIDHHMKISLNNTQVVVEITGGGKLDYSKQWARQQTPKDYLGNTVDAWFLSDSFYNDIPYNRGWASFNNITIKSNIFTFAPTAAPTTPTTNPTNAPSISTTFAPSSPPTLTTLQPTHTPTLKPTGNPTNNPTNNPSIIPTKNPTIIPTLAPSNNPTGVPTEMPTKIPTLNPTFAPSIYTSERTTNVPTNNPITSIPTSNPIIALIVKYPTMNPTIDENISIVVTDGFEQTVDINNGNGGMISENNNESLVFLIIIISVGTFIVSLTTLFIIEKCVGRYINKKNAKNKVANTKVLHITPIQTNITPIQKPVQPPKVTAFPPMDTHIAMIATYDTPQCEKRKDDILNEITTEVFCDEDFEQIGKPKLNNPVSDSEFLYRQPSQIEVKETTRTPVGEDGV